MHRAEHQVSGLGCLDGDGEAFGVAHFADYDHIRRLPEDMPQPFMKRVGIQPDFPLIHIAGFVLVQKLDGVFYRDDIAVTLSVDAVQKGGKGRCLSVPGGTCYEDQSLRSQGVLFDPGVQTELADCRNRLVDMTDGDGE